jgi:methionyl-tRNA formyltransferase
VTVHVLTPRFDQGEILAQKEIPLGDEETGETLFHRLSVEGAGILAETIRSIESGSSSPKRQDEALASYFSSPTDDEARIRWGEGAREIRNLVRGLHPRPGAWTTLGGRRCRVSEGSYVETSGNLSPPGLIVDSGNGVVTVATGRGFFRIEGLEVEPPEGPPIPARLDEFPVGSVLGVD